MPGVETMIARHWRGLAKAEFADDYIAHLQHETFVSLRKLAGFEGASILQRSVADGVEFLIVTHWRSLDDVRAFAGDHIETAVVPESVQRMMVDYDRRAHHYEVHPSELPAAWPRSGRQRVPGEGAAIMSRVETSTPPNTPTPIGPYSHIAKVGQFITIGGTAGTDPATGEFAGPDVAEQTRQILASFDVMLRSVGSDLAHVVHINVFLRDIKDFDAMNHAYVQMMGEHRPARTVIGVHELPRPGLRLTMNLTAVTRE